MGENDVVFKSNVELLKKVNMVIKAITFGCTIEAVENYFPCESEKGLITLLSNASNVCHRHSHRQSHRCRPSTAIAICIHIGIGMGMGTGIDSIESERKLIRFLGNAGSRKYA